MSTDEWDPVRFRQGIDTGRKTVEDTAYFIVASWQ